MAVGSPFDFGPGPYRDHFAITPSDTVNFAQGMARGIYVGGAGNVSVVSPQGVVATYTAPPVGSIIPTCCIRVNATLTTATLLIGLS